MKKLLFSITKKDFEIQTFRSGGKGGQNQNKVETGVRIIHKASGARGEARDSRSQAQNRKAAFLRLTDSTIFKLWLQKEIAKHLGEEAEIQKRVDDLMNPDNIVVEYL